MEDMLIGVTDRTIPVFIPDPASTTGAGKTGLAAAAITVTYTRYETDNDVVTTDVTSSVNDLSALTDAHNDWGWKEVSSTLSKGQYRLDIADAAFASGAWYVVVQVTITSGTAAATPKAFRLVSFNALDAVRGGLTALPNAAADAAGGLPISDAGGLDLDAQLVTKINDILTDTGTTLQAEVDGIQADTEDIQTRLPAALSGGRMDASIGAVQNNVNGLIRTGTAQSVGANDIVFDSGAAFVDDALIGATVVITDGTQVGSRSIITDYVGATDTATLGNGWTGATPSGTPTFAIFASAAGSGVAQTGDAFARLGAPAGASISADIAAVKVDTAAILVDTGTTLDGRIPAALVSGRMDASVGAMAANTMTAAAAAADLTTELQSGLATAASLATAQTSIDDIPTNAELATAIAAALTATVADSIPADGSRPSIAQGIYLITQFLLERSVSGTTVTVKKPDGTTSLFTLTLGDATSPTSITRAT